MLCFKFIGVLLFAKNEFFNEFEVSMKFFVEFLQGIFDNKIL